MNWKLRGKSIWTYSIISSASVPSSAGASAEASSIIAASIGASSIKAIIAGASATEAAPASSSNSITESGVGVALLFGMSNLSGDDCRLAPAVYDGVVLLRKNKKG